MPTNLTDVRLDSYTFGSFDTIADQLEFDYSSVDYAYFRQVLNGDASIGIQLGGLLAQNIVFWITAFEIGLLPTVVIEDIKSGKSDNDAAQFANNFLADQHGKIIEAVEMKNGLGDTYMSFNLDRKLEAIPPDTADPGFLPYSGGLASLRVIQNKYVRNIETGRKVKMKITRNYTDKEIEYNAVLQTKSKYTDKIKVPEKLKIPNVLGKPPVVLMPNLKRAGSLFGWSELYWCLPLFELYHKTLVRGFEAQQYSGKPVLTITGIEGDVPSWFERTFGIDVSQQGSDALDSQLLDIFRRYKMLALSGNVKAEFVESKAPTGKTTEILKIVFANIAQTTGLPEFLFGGETGNSTDSLAREQLLSLKKRIELKQTKLNEYLIELIRMAMVLYSTVTKNEETGEPLEKIGLVNNYSDTFRYRIRLIWPEIIGSDGRLKHEIMSMMANAGAVSRKSLLDNYQGYFPNPEVTLTEIEEENKRFGEMDTVPQTSAQKNSKERTRNNPSSQSSGQNEPKPQLEKN